MRNKKPVKTITAFILAGVLALSGITTAFATDNGGTAAPDADEADFKEAAGYGADDAADNGMIPQEDEISQKETDESSGTDEIETEDQDAAEDTVLLTDGINPYASGETAFVVYSDDDLSLTFYYGDAPDIGDTYNGKKVTELYTDIGQTDYQTDSDVPWDSLNETVTDIVIDDSFCNASVTSLACWFYGFANADFTGLDHIDTSAATSLYSTFNGCEKLDGTDALASWDVGNVTTMYGTFRGCSSLTDVDGLAGWDTGSVTTLRNTFRECTSLSDISGLASWDVGNATTLYGAFYRCISLTDLNALSGWDVGMATNMYETFCGCTGLTDVAGLASWDTGKVTNLMYAFQFCSGLTDIDALASWDMGSTENLLCAFYGCSGLETIDVSGWDTSNVTSMQSMFSGCTSLTTIYSDDDVFVTSGITNPDNGSSMFRYCENLVGGDGTTFSEDNTSYLMAHVDNEDDPGYFTDAREEEPEAFAAYSDDDLSLTFYYKGLPDVGEKYHGKTVTALYTGLDEADYASGSEVPWSDVRETVKDVVIDDSFAETCPESLAYWFYGFNSADFSGLENIDVRNVTTLRGTFTGCAALAGTDALAAWDTCAVTDMQDTFSDCTAITDVDGLAEWDAGAVTTLKGAFYGCASLSDIDGLKAWDTSAVTDVSYMFGGCTGLSGADALAKWNMSAVTDMSHMFDGCGSLEKLDVGEWDTRNVRDMSYMFHDCTALTTIYSDDDVFVTYAVTAGDSMFTGCTSLVGGAGTAYDAGNVTYTMAHVDTAADPGYFTKLNKEAFAVYSEDDTSLTFYYGAAPEAGAIYNDKTATNVYDDVDGISATGTSAIPWYSHRSAIASVVVDESFKAAQPVSLAYWFYTFTKAEFTGLENIDTSKATSLYNTFYNCYKLNDLSDLSAWDTGNVTTMQNTFYGCSELEDVDELAAWDTGNVTTLYQTFCSCKKLENVDGLAAWDVGSVTTMHYTFNDCFALTNVDGLKKWDTSAVTELYGTFYECSNLTNIDGLAEWDTSAATTLVYLFYNCPELENVDALNTWDTGAVTSLQYMFYKCSSLTDAYGLRKWDTSAVTTMNNMFRDCKSLEELDVGGWNTANVTDMRYMFYGCSALTTIYSDDDVFVTSGITSASNGNYMFQNCAKLVGGAGTAYSSSSYTYKMAHVDTADNPGYFTEKPETVSVKALITWDDNDNEYNNRPDGITLQLYRDGLAVDGATLALSEDNEWSGEITDLLKYRDDGVEYTYTLSEPNIPGYTTKSDVSDNIFTFTSKTETTKITGEKAWNDDNDRDGLRPSEITVHLMADEDEFDTCTAAADDGWTYEFNDIPTHMNGSEVIYAITEDEVYGYTAEVNGYDMINTHGAATTTITGTVAWDDDDNRDGLRPGEVTVYLYADGTLADEQTITVINGWAYEFTDLYEYESGKKIEYEIVEEDVTGYTAKYTDTGITNTHEIETTSVSGTKTWDDDNNRDGIRPSEITVWLYADGDEINSQAISAADGWMWDFNELPVYRDGGVKVEYTIRETAVDGYDGVLTDTGITNTHIPEKISVSGTKTWNDNNNQDGVRPTEIKIHLMADGTEIDSVVVTADEKWTWNFTDLPKYKDGKEIVYNVTEDIVTGYDTEYSETGYDVSNTHTPETVDIKGTKTWIDGDNQDGLRPESITIYLLADGVKIDSVTVPADIEKTNVMMPDSPLFIADDPNVWSWSFTGLPKYKDGTEIVYTIEEVAVDGYITTVDGYDITNTHIPETVSVEGTKTWDDADDQDGLRPAYITIHLYAGEEEIDSMIIEPDTKGNWSWSFTDLPKYKDGVEIAYTVTEDAVDEYNTSYSEEGYDITNTHEPETVNIAGTKTWDDNDDQDGKRPGSITVYLYANGKLTDEAAVTKSDGWRWEFTDLDRYENGTEITYTIAEGNIDGYTAKTDGYDITNTHTPGKTGVNVQKIWADDDDRDGVRPNEVEIELIKNNERTGNTILLSEANNWAGSFTGLDEYTDGEKNEYSVMEQVGNGYGYTASSYEADGTSTFFIVNEHTPETTSVSGKKVWNDAGDRDGIRPGSVTVYLMADGVPATDEDGNIISAVVSGKTDWEFTFNDLAKYHDHGAEVKYTLVEDVPDGYVSDVSADNVITNTHEPKLTEVTGIKTWDDDNNRDGIRPSEITVWLYADGDEVASQTVTADNGWMWEFGSLDKYRDGGKEIKYSVKETAIDGYDGVVTSGGITNTHEPEKTEANVKAIWGDSVDNARPDAITVHLWANGTTPAGTATLSEGNGWAYIFAGLNKYESGKEITYTITVDPTDGYDCDIDGFTIIVTPKAEAISVSGTITWDDDGNRDRLRPGTATVTLFADGAETQSITANTDSGWTYTFTDLDKYAKNGEEIIYTVAETAVSGYKTTYNGYDITNTHKPEMISVSGAATWDDDNDRDGIRPGLITARLFADGKEFDVATVSDKTNWMYEFTDLYKYADGKEIIYTVKEDNVDGYKAAYDGYDITNTHAPELISIAGTKTWDDKDDKDGIRPGLITVRLFADGEEIDAAAASDETGWVYEFTDLYKYADGKEVTYTIAEDDVSGYEAVYDGYDITNTHKTKTTDTVKKDNTGDTGGNDKNNKKSNVNGSDNTNGTNGDNSTNPDSKKSTDNSGNSTDNSSKSTDNNKKSADTGSTVKTGQPMAGVIAAAIAALAAAGAVVIARKRRRA